MKKRRHSPDQMPGSDTPAVGVLGQLEEAIKQTRRGVLTPASWQAFVEHRNPFEKAKPALKSGVRLSQAIAILGENKVVGIGQAATARGFKKFDPGVPIRFSEATLRECAVQNREAGTDWRLVYVFGRSLRELREQLGTDPKRQPCVFANDWWLKSEEDDWATVNSESGYYLVDFNGRWGNTSWNQQEEEIRKLGGEFIRTPEAIIAEAITTIFQVHNERLLKGWYHWGSSLDSCGNRVYVGDFGQDGWSVNYNDPRWDDGDDLQVCLSRKFQS